MGEVLEGNVGERINVHVHGLIMLPSQPQPIVRVQVQSQP